ncbi:MAG: hypothetical protein AB7V62_05005 [Thermoleophilia bacterium]
MSPLFRRRPLVRAEVALYSPTRAAVVVHPADNRRPGQEEGDRFDIAVGSAAAAVRSTPPPRWEAFRDALARLASGVAAVRGPLPEDIVPIDGFGPGGDLAVVPWDGPGRLGVEFDLIGSPVGPVPRVAKRPGEAGPAVEVAALAVLLHVAEADEPGRLRLALGLEGLLSWYRDSDRNAPPRDALRFATAHADGRLREAGAGG